MGLKQEKWMAELVYELMQAGCEETKACETVLGWKEKIDKNMGVIYNKFVKEVCKTARECMEELKSND